MLLDTSEIFEKLFDGKYNPALVNICYMVRRGELPELEISVIDTLNKITAWENDAFLSINKALAYIMDGKWDDARQEVRDIDSNLSSAIEWWKKEQVVVLCLSRLDSILI